MSLQSINFHFTTPNIYFSLHSEAGFLFRPWNRERRRGKVRCYPSERIFSRKLIMAFSVVTHKKLRKLKFSNIFNHFILTPDFFTSSSLVTLNLWHNRFVYLTFTFKIRFSFYFLCSINATLEITQPTTKLKIRFEIYS